VSAVFMVFLLRSVGAARATFPQMASESATRTVK